MSCPRCGKPVPPGAAFCPACGVPVVAPPPSSLRPPTAAARPTAMPRPTTAPSPAVGNVAADFEAQKKRNAMILGGVSLAAVLVALVGAGAYLRLGASKPRPTLQVRADGTTALQLPAHVNGDLRLPAQVNPAPLQVAAERKQMPADVEAWLKHLEECEKRKVTISGDQMADALVLMQKMQALGAGMGMMDPYDQSKGDGDDKDPGTYTKGKVMDFRPRWEELIQFFNSVPPPEECKPLAADYNRALGEVPGMMGDIGDILNSVSNDPSAALQQMNKFKGSSYGDIDRYFARTDEKLTQICQKYDHNKWFNIKADVQGGSPLSMFGNMGGQGGGGLPSLGQ